MSYKEVLTKLGEETVRKVLAVYSRYTDGEVSSDDAVAVIAAIVAKANARAVTLADLSLASTLMLQLRVPVAVTGTTVPAVDPDRLAKGAQTLLALTDVTPERIARFARSEPLEAASRAYSAAIKANPDVTGWTRGISGDACQLCTWWARDGQVWPDDHEMPTHKGCTCAPIPTTKEKQQ